MLLRQASGSECAATSRQKDSGTAGVFIILNRQKRYGWRFASRHTGNLPQKEETAFQTVSSYQSGIAGVCFTA